MSFEIGVLGVPLPSVSRVTPDHLVRLRELGVGSIGIYMTERERDAPIAWSERLRHRLQETELSCLYVVGPLGNLIAGESVVRRRAVEDAVRGLVAAAALGAKRLMIGPGGFSPRGPWWFHPANFTADARAALVRSLSELARHAEGLGVGITVEGHQCSVLESPAVMRRVLDDVDSDAVGASLDYVNFLTPPQIARLDESLHEMAEALGPRLTALHVKDAIVRPRLAIHIDEVPAGEGDLDLRAVLALATSREVPAVLEHLPRARADAAIAHVCNLAAGG